ncbi:winged helix-turn-helix transcriptional regulator [Frankia sp. AgB1.9]|nr:winged helix-turn-helix transcriptional regulator [Frankia sp. AgW1.1]MBL7551749.1 winged helix-turn-helix transcriptional regulator [Frankia sp. AgB1.9]MBL7623364.1 winged helix-turn-helix transcriptional regulator [Frankia sp. AgB1.8]
MSSARDAPSGARRERTQTLNTHTLPDHSAGNGGRTTVSVPSGTAVDGAADLSANPGHLARRLQQVIHQLWTASVSTDTTPPQFVVLNSLRAAPDIDQRTLGERACLDRSTVADVVARLVQRGLIRRVRDPHDGRRNVLRLTTRGEGTHTEVAHRAQTMNEQLLAPLSGDEQLTLVALLNRVVDAHPAGRSGGAEADPD